MILADTSVWSLFLLRKKSVSHPALDTLKALLHDDRIAIPGLVLQELLSGVRSKKQLTDLTEILSAFDLILADREDHLLAGQYFAICRAKGIQGSSFDFLLCAMSVRRNYPILTTDKDFEHYQKHLPITLVEF